MAELVSHLCGQTSNLSTHPRTSAIGRRGLAIKDRVRRPPLWRVSKKLQDAIPKRTVLEFDIVCIDAVDGSSICQVPVDLFVKEYPCQFPGTVKAVNPSTAHIRRTAIETPSI